MLIAAGVLLCLWRALSFAHAAILPAPAGGALDGVRHRVIISSDIGGTDPDDFQSLVHVLVYADVLEIEGLISSPFDNGRKEDILRVIDAYERDYENLRSYSDKYPTPAELRAITRQGETERAPYAGVRRSTEGSEWIVQCARRDDQRPLNVLVWGGIEDVAQALHDAPDILPKLRVYYIGGPNKKWGPDAYQYIAANHPALWIIEANATYRGWFTGGNQSGEWSNRAFVTRHVAGHGALGDLFVSKKDDLKMGDTPSVAWLLKGTPEDPSQPGWGGQFVRAWERPYVRFTRLTTAEDRMEHFGILELVLPLGPDAPEKAEGRMVVENQSLIGHADGQGNLRFRFCSRDAKVFRYTILSNVPSLDGKAGQITSAAPPPSVALHPSPRFPNWWTDDPAPQFTEGSHIGARTVSRWREEFLRDFAERVDRCRTPAITRIAATEGLLPPKPSVITKPRVIILSDFPPLDVIPGGAGYGPPEKRSDPDDVQSMVRFLVYANEFDVEGLVASAATFANIAQKQNILDILDLYDQVDENLRKHDPRYPTADQLRAVTWQGRDGTWGRPANEIIGEGRDSEASEAIIKVVDGPDPRPVWVLVWGGPADLAQAIWKVQNTRSPSELERFLSKLRVFLIGLGNRPAQDGSGQWMLDSFPDLFVIVSQKTYGGMFAQDSPIGKLEWLNANVREGRGPLGAAYPPTGFNPKHPGQQEGDTPSFLYLYSAVRGMNDPEKPEQESWGGQYVRPDPSRKHWYDGPGAKSVSKWLPDMQRDFATRMAWCKASAE
jgi:hypothetical protein